MKNLSFLGLSVGASLMLATCSSTTVVRPVEESRFVQYTPPAEKVVRVETRTYSNN